MVMQPSITGLTTPPLINRSRMQNVAHARILIVDDDRMVLHMLKHIFTGAGFAHINTASNGREALQIIAATPPDLVLLDLVMPDMGGFEVCQAIEQMQLRHPPMIVMQTQSTYPQHLIEAFNHGIVDYISKPIQKDLILMRCILQLERRYLEMQLASERDRMQSELREAAHLQGKLSPTPQKIRSCIDDLPVDMAGVIISSSELGGDIWGIQRLASPHIGIYTADVMGHGLKAALHTFRIHSLMQDILPIRDNAALMLSMLNLELISSFPTGYFATMCYATLDIENKQLTYSTAGAPLPFVLRGGQLLELEGSGLPLGCSRQAHYDQKHFALRAGDVVALYSDALFESIPHLTPADFAEILSMPHSTVPTVPTAQERLNHTMQQLMRRTEHATLNDDLTLVILHIH